MLKKILKSIVRNFSYNGGNKIIFSEYGSKSDNFEECFNIVMHHEGVLSTDKVDPGNHGGFSTKYGVTMETLVNYKRRFVNVEYQPINQDIIDLTPETVRDIGLHLYWKKMRCDELPFGVDLMVLDAGYNSGVGQSVKWLQRAVGATEDGIVGAKTINAVWQADAQHVIMDMAKYRAKLYLHHMPEEVEERFELGWIKRLLHITQVAALMKARQMYYHLV